MWISTGSDGRRDPSIHLVPLFADVAGLVMRSLPDIVQELKIREP
jgi:hypothetical protein